MNEVPWSLHLLSEVLSAFTVEDPQALRSVIYRVAEAVDAEVVAILDPRHVSLCIGLRPDQQALLPPLVAEHPATIPLAGAMAHTCWAPLGQDQHLLLVRLGQPFNLEERSLLRAMARSVELSTQVLRAVQAEREAKEDALIQATHDALTGLPSRGLVLARIEELLQHSSPEQNGRITVLFVDIDRFKQINDVHGHASGDLFLCTVADVLRGVVRGDDLVGRLSGDEFVVVTCTRNPGDAEALARRIIERVSRPLTLAGKLVSHSPSIGIAFADLDVAAQGGKTAELLIENADMAMYRAKDLGRGRFACYDRSLRQQAQRLAATEMELRRAVRQGELVPFFQPIFRAVDRGIVGFEALARWQHPIHGLLPPSEFVEVAEDTGLILEIDLLILKMACRSLAGWKRLFPDLPLRLSVNVSARTFVEPSLADQVAEALRVNGLTADDLYLEITETMLVEDIDATTIAVERLKQLGVLLAVDDFGTGYSSLLYLKRFPVGILKIDRSFIDGLGIDREDEVIVKAVISVAHALDIDLVAEGVETDRQLEMLADLDCQFVQGYGLGRPLDAAAAELLLEKASAALGSGMGL
ncbi:MAG: putative bifunctional diguanylate cyclase/phosphodiesterase [Cyanobium sp.]